LLNPSVWPDAIAISEWFHKQPTRDSRNANDKRRRIGSGENTQQRHSEQITLSQSQGQSSVAAEVGVTVDIAVHHDSRTTVVKHNGRPNAANSINDRDVDDVIQDDDQTILMSDETIVAAVNIQDGGRQ